MLARFVFHTSMVLGSLVVATTLTTARAIPIPEDEAALEFVGQFNNVGARHSSSVTSRKSKD